MIEIIPTVVPDNVNDLATKLVKVLAVSASVHVDIDDGVFAPVFTWPYTGEGTLGPIDFSLFAGMDVEMHLMTKNPRELGREFAQRGANRILGHIEAFDDADAARGALEEWKKSGAEEVGLGLLFDTPIESIASVVSSCDVVHLMSIRTIGTQGIPYDPAAPARIAEFHARFPETLISVDGGVSESNIVELARAGARRFGVGSALSKAEDPKAAYEKLKTLAESAV